MEQPEIILMNEIAKRSLVRKSELFQSLNAKREHIEPILKNLIARGFVMIVSPVGETSYALTQKGIKEMNKGSQ